MKILFFGSDTFAIPSLQALKNSRHEILGVVAQPDKPSGRGQHLQACPAATAAKKLGLNLLQPEKLDAVAVEKLAALKPDLLAVVAYGKFLPTPLIKQTPHQAVNVHPSLLPKYRGAAPIQWAILNGDDRTGVTTMTISEEMDAGDIFLQCETDIDPAENHAMLEERLSLLGADLLLKTIDGLEKGRLKPQPQDSSKVVLAPKLTKEEGHLNWREPAETLYNRIRALNPWPGTFCFLNEKILKIFEAAPTKTGDGEKPGTVLDNKQGITVACGQGALCLLEVQLEGKRRMSATEFLKGHSIPVGTLLR